jgi:hypothetical protein
MTFIRTAGMGLLAALVVPVSSWAGPADDIQRLSCETMTQASIGRQKWFRLPVCGR